MKSFAHLLAALTGIGTIKYAAANPITPPPTCPTVTQTTTACPKTCTFPTCAILSTLTAHCGCPDPAVTVQKTFSCTPDKCEPFPPPCATFYTVKRISDCAGPTSSSLPPSSQSSPIPSSSLSSSQPPVSSETSSSSEPPVSSSYQPESSITLPPESSSTCSSKTSSSSSESKAPLSETSTAPPPPSNSTTPGPGPSPGSSSPPTPPPPTNTPSPGSVPSHGQRRLRRPFLMFWL